ncbi:uncharacterized protein LOC129951451 [Eupeodes corollae]|uniref:uncharacterized protein LOC129951451 n=1 Tax=Eupeodes corollae TaxID=290404 RepID=UPI0024908880|nr:uncharacterized protein LOC129951451 [Eupeodes corollae]
MFSSPAVVVSAFLLLACVFSTTLANPAKNQTLVEIITIDDASKLKDISKGAELIPMSQDRDTKGVIRYTLGNRSSGDRLVSQASDSVSWNTPQSVQLRLEYPASGTGAVITHVQIDVNQSSNSGQAYVIAGGIGQRRIVIIVEAYNTYYFSYVSNIYGI